jgi:hypothetical protein
MGDLILIYATVLARDFFVFPFRVKLAQENFYQPQGLSISLRFVLLGRAALRVTL